MANSATTEALGGFFDNPQLTVSDSIGDMLMNPLGGMVNVTPGTTYQSMGDWGQQHYQDFGQAEGRVVPDGDYAAYVQSYPDLLEGTLRPDVKYLQEKYPAASIPDVLVGGYENLREGMGSPGQLASWEGPSVLGKTLNPELERTRNLIDILAAGGDFKAPKGYTSPIQYKGNIPGTGFGVDDFAWQAGNKAASAEQQGGFAPAGYKVYNALKTFGNVARGIPNTLQNIKGAAAKDAIYDFNANNPRWYSGENLRGVGSGLIDRFTPGEPTLPYEPTLIDAEEAIPAHIYNAMERERDIERYNKEYNPFNFGQTHADTLQSFRPISHVEGGMKGFIEDGVQTDFEPVDVMPWGAGEQYMDAQGFDTVMPDLSNLPISGMGGMEDQTVFDSTTPGQIGDYLRAQEQEFMLPSGPEEMTEVFTQEDKATDWRTRLGIDPAPGYTWQEVLGIGQPGPGGPVRPAYNRDEFGNVASLTRFTEPEVDTDDFIINNLIDSMSRVGQPGPGGPARESKPKDDSNARQAREAEERARLKQSSIQESTASKVIEVFEKEKEKATDKVTTIKQQQKDHRKEINKAKASGSVTAEASGKFKAKTLHNELKAAEASKKALGQNSMSNFLQAMQTRQDELNERERDRQMRETRAKNYGDAFDPSGWR